jgi:nucleoside-diphosphate-sugar epimerase
MEREKPLREPWSQVSDGQRPATPPLVAVVTGSTGFIGRHLVAALLENGWTVRAVLRPETSASPPPGADAIVAPLVAASLADVCRGASVVIHLAARVKAPSAAAFGRANVTPTRELANAAASAGARLIHISSQAAAGPGTPSDPRSEQDPPRPITPYGRSKEASERVVRATEGLKWTILRPVSVYGPGDRAFLPLFTLSKLGLVPLLQSAEASYMFVHVADVVKAVLLAARTGRALGQTCFIGHPEPVSARRLLTAIGRAVGRQPLIGQIPGIVGTIAASTAPVLWRLGREPALDRARLDELRAPGWVCRVDHARDVLAFNAAIDVDEGFRRSADWYVRGARRSSR